MYVPNNVLVFIAAYAGSISGMAVAEKVLVKNNPIDYDAIAKVAGAFAQSFDTEWGLRPTTSLDVSIIEEECEGTWEGRYPVVSNPSNILPATYTPQCKALIALVTSSASYFAAQGITPPNPGGGNGFSSIIDLSVNAAGVDLCWKDALGKPTCVMRTGALVNTAGAFNGGGVGNKSILGARNILKGKPISSLLGTSFKWENLLGPAGQFYNPPQPSTMVDLYMNLLIDFDPLGVHDLRYLVICDSSGVPAIANATGIYSNPGGLNTLDYSWNPTLDVLIVNAPPNPVPGGVPVNISTGPSWLNNTYKWSALVAANPTAIFVDAFPATFGTPNGDGGAPAGAIIPAISLTSGDSGTVIKSGKHILEWLVNGINVLEL
jgi:hypothetical protein